MMYLKGNGSSMGASSEPPHSFFSFFECLSSLSLLKPNSYHITPATSPASVTTTLPTPTPVATPPVIPSQKCPY